MRENATVVCRRSATQGTGNREIVRIVRILLVQPGIDRRIRSLGHLEPLPLEILAAALPLHEVRIFDYRYEDSLTRELAEWRPDVVGVTALTVEYRQAVRVIEETRAAAPAVRVVVGGTHASMVPEDFCLSGVDAIVIGLGHETLRELVEAYEAGADPSAIPGLALPRDGKLLFTDKRSPEASFDTIPNPDRSLTKKYRRRYRATFSLDPEGDAVSITSLGCPGRCSFCSSWKQNEGRYLERSAEAVVEDLLSIPSRRIMLADDNSLHNVERAWKIVELLQRAKVRKHIRTYVRADTIASQPELMKALHSVGFRALIVGYEAVTDKRLQGYRKGNTVETNRAAMRVLRSVGIENRAMFVVAQDFAPADFRELSEFIRKEGLRTPLFTVLTPVPGTPLYERSKKDLLTHEYAYFDYAHCLLPTQMDYMEFFREYAGLFRRAYSIRRYAKDCLSEWGQFITTGKWPRTERQNVSWAAALFLTLIFRQFLKPLRRDYEMLAATNRQAGSSAQG